MYDERDVLTRLEAKVCRTFRRLPKPYPESRRVLQIDARQFPSIRNIRAVITSPPYMNELDYVWITGSAFGSLNVVYQWESNWWAAIDAAFSSLPLRAACLRPAPGIQPGRLFHSRGR